MDIEAVRWADGRLRFLDQTLLPHEERYVETADHHVVAEAIRALRIRGAPAIGVAAAYAVVLAALQSSRGPATAFFPSIRRAIDLLASTRPTAVNLFTALDRMRSALDRSTALPASSVVEVLLEHADSIFRHDVESCRLIGELGAALIVPGSAVLTHCNAGALATAGAGTALSIITTAARQGKILRVFVDETRPLLQGARLTAWELARARIPVTLITDSTAATVLRKGMVTAVIVGADRITATGDVANKVGTYPLALMASVHDVPFYVAAPSTTLDRATETGAEIVIEERDPEEVTHLAGTRVAAQGVDVFSPAFDVTPNELVTAIVTELGVLRPPYTGSIRRLGPPQ
jgi:methylthioribose-1-phosphate isomerase